MARKPQLVRPRQMTTGHIMIRSGIFRMIAVAIVSAQTTARGDFLDPPTPPMTNLTLLCALTRPSDEPIEQQAKRRAAMLERAAKILYLLRVQDRFTVGAYSDKVCLWTNSFQIPSDGAKSNALMFLETAIGDYQRSNGGAVHASRLDLALDKAIGLHSGTVLLMTSGLEDCPPAITNGSTSTGHWAATACAAFVSQRLTAASFDGDRAHFTLLVLAVFPDAEGEAFCRELAQHFGGRYRRMPRRLGSQGQGADGSYLDFGH